MRRTRWIFGLAAVVAASLQLAGMGPVVTVSAGDPPASGAAVKIDNFSFGPTEMTIAAGTTITWTNHDDVPHVVASEDKLFKSKALDTEDQFSFTFTKPGTYLYYCAIHPKMTAKVVVK